VDTHHEHGRHTPHLLRPLWATSVLGGLGRSGAGSAGILLTEHAAGSDSAARWSQALLVAGSAAAALGLSAVTNRRSRTAASNSGVDVAVADCVVVIAAITENLPLVFWLHASSAHSCNG